MSYFIQWSGPAFRRLESLPQKLAFEIIRRTDLLSPFPELGNDLGSRFEQLAGLRQLIVDKRWRVIYEVNQKNTTIWILNVQSCRQKLPSKRSMKKQKEDR
jgi:mRNA-degrading endonuclease RelE of RelBE toxin-antitoxin system